MLLIVHNLPKEVTSFDVRQLIQEQCGLREVILDNLLDEGPGKRITVGLAEEEDAVILLRKLNGLHYKTCQLYVEDVRKKKSGGPSYPVLIPAGLQPQVSKPWYIENVPKTAATLQANYSNMPYYMTSDSNNMIFGKQTQATQQNTSIFNRNYEYQQNSMLQPLNANSLMVYPLPASNSNKNQAPNAPPYFKSYQNDRDKQGDRRDDTTQVNWRENKSPPSKRHVNFGNFSQRETRFGDKTSEWHKNTEVSRHCRNDDRSPPRGRNIFRENKNDDRRDDFGTRNARSSRSNPRDINEQESGRERDSSFGRQRDLVFDQRERQNDQKRNYEQVNRIARENVSRLDRSYGNVFETSTTFSSKPESSFFTKPNRNVYNTINESRVFGETSNSKFQLPSAKENTFKSQVNFPPLKRARFDPPPQHFGNKKYVNPNAPSNKTTDFQKMMTRHSNWRSQSASLLAKEVLKNASNSKIENTIFKTVFKKLRECIMSRLDVIMGDKIATNLDEILRGYRTRFNNRDDINFFKSVMRKVERENEENTDEITGPSVGKEKQQYQESGKFNKGRSVANPFYSPNVAQMKQHQESGKLYKGANIVNTYFSPRPQLSIKPNLTGIGKQQGLISQNRPKMPFIKDSKNKPTLPKYPNRDKQAHKNFKKNALLEHEEGFYTMEPELERAVNEEVDILAKCYVEACEPSTNKDENNLRNKLIASSVHEFKKIIKLDVTKRILNVTDGLVLRIFSTPKPPPKAALEEFLKQHGAISLKKADTSRMFIAYCDSYESYDRLLAAKAASFGNITINIKPFHVLGPVTKKNIKTNQTTVTNTVQDFTKDVDESEIDLTNDVTDDADVMLIENEQSEVVEIRDDLDKSLEISGNTSDNVDVNNDNVEEINDLNALDSNNRDDDCNEKIFNDKVDDSNVGVDGCNEKVIASNENVDISDTNASNEKNEDSRDKVPNSQSDEQVNKIETNVVESLDDIFKADEILEDDLEDF